MAKSQDFDPETASLGDFDATHTPSDAGEPPLPQDEVLSDDDPVTKPKEVKEENPVTEEVEEDKSDGDSPDLDPELASLNLPPLPDELKDDPAWIKRTSDIARGINKKVEQAKARADEAEQVLEVLKPYQHAINIIERGSPEEVVDMLRFLAAERKVDLDAPAPTLSPDSEYEYEGEQKLHARLTEAEKRTQQLEAIAKEFQQEKAEKAKQAEFDAFIAKEAPKVMGLLSKTESGWGVTKDMVAEAAKRFPDMLGDLDKAVKMAFVEEYANHKAGIHSKVKTGPEMLSSSSARGKVMPSGDPEDWSIHDINAAL